MSFLVAIDFETSGREAYSACAVGLTRIEAKGIGPSYYSLIRPPSSRVLFSEIHGLTWQDLKDAPDFAKIYPEIAAFVRGAEAFVAHNASFDRRVLEGSLAYAGLAGLDLPFLCTLKASRKLLPKLPSRSLDSLCRHFSISFRHHHAGSDAEACAELFVRLREMGATERMMRLN